VEDLAARHPRLKAFHNTVAPPPGWTGKNNALHQGQKHADGDWLLFVDSDVVLQPDVLSSCMEMLVRKGIEAGAERLVLISSVHIPDWYSHRSSGEWQWLAPMTGMADVPVTANPGGPDDDLSAARKAVLQLHGCFVIGLPGETEETARETLRFAMSLGLDTLQFSGAVPFPGTAFFERCEREGWLQTREWNRWLDAGEQSGIVHYPGISQEKINLYVDRGLKQFYFRPSYMVRFLFKTRSRADLYRKLRGARNFLSYLFGK
jgi:glycosyltransferase involved in cell wall biosynthesis